MLKLDYVKNSLLLATPLVLSQLVYTLNGFISTIMLAKLGHDVLAASALLFAVSTCITVITMSPLLALGTLVGRANGENNYQEIGNLMQQAWIFSMLLSLLAMLIFAEIKPILLFFHQKPELIHIIQPYFNIALFGVPAQIINLASYQFASGVKEPKYTLIATIINVAFALSSGYILIFGKFGLHAYGVAGWGMGYAIGAWASCIYLNLVLFFNKKFSRFHLFKAHMRNEWQHLKLLFQVGWPIIFQISAELLSYFFVTLMIGWLSETDLAASQITQQYMFLIIIPFFGIVSAASILVGTSVGENNRHDAKAYGDICNYIGIAYTLIFIVAFLLFHKTLLGIFINSNETHAQELFHLGYILFLIRIIGLIFDGIRNVLIGALRGLLDTRFSMFVTILSLGLIRIPLSYILGFTFAFGIIGIASSEIIAMFIGAILLWWRWHKSLKTLVLQS